MAHMQVVDRPHSENPAGATSNHIVKPGRGIAITVNE